MARKGLFIAFLLSLLIAFFYLRPILFKKEPEPLLTDRMPIGNLIGKINLIDLAREAHTFMYYNKIPLREYLSYEFILAQSKVYGINTQKPIYFFSNVGEEWGSIVSVQDSSKIYSGINRLKKDFEIFDTIVGGQKVYKFKKERIYFTYDKKWLFFYKGPQLPKRLYHVMYSKKGDEHIYWKELKYKSPFKNDNIQVLSKWKKLNEIGVKSIFLSKNMDSLNSNIKCVIIKEDMFPIGLKNNGLNFESHFNGNKNIQLHFDLTKMKNETKHPLWLLLQQYARKIGFPLKSFIDAWEGDIAFIEGGLHKVKENIIETEMDEEFNMVEVKKTREVLKPGYALLLSMNKNQKSFVSNLFAKGIMRKENNRFYILNSPPLKIIQKNKFLFLYSSDFAPKVKYSPINGGFLTFKNVKYSFVIDKPKDDRFSVSIQFPILSFFYSKIL